MYKNKIIKSIIFAVVITLELLWLLLSLEFIENKNGFAYIRKVFDKFNYPISLLSINDFLQITFILIAAIIIFFVIMAVGAAIAGLGEKISEKITQTET